MSEVGSNSSAEEISPEEIEEIHVRDDEEDKEASPPAAAAEDPPVEVAAQPPAEAEDPPVEVLKADDDPPVEVLAPAASEPAAAAQEQPPPAAAQPPAASASGEQVTLENVEDVEEVPRPPPVEPPVARAAEAVAAAAVSSSAAQDDDEDDDDDDIDETLTERLIGLTEMFPDFVRSGTVSLVKGSWSMTQSMYGYSRSAAWIFFSTASILIMPVMIETERMSIMDQQKQAKTQMLLGPGVAGAGAGPSLGPPPI